LIGDSEPAVPQPDRPAAARDNPFAPWALGQLRSLAGIEPRLGFQVDLEAEQFEIYRLHPADHPFLATLQAHAEVLQRPPLVVFAFAWLARGGAEVAGISLLREAQAAVGIGNVLAMVLDYDNDEGRAWLPDGTRLFSLPKTPQIAPEDRSRFVVQYLANMQPRAIVNCHSHTMWELMRDYGQPLSVVSRLYAMLFCFDFTKQGTPVGYAASHLAETIQHLSGVLVDSASFGRTLTDLFGFPESLAAKLQVLYQPAGPRTEPSAPATGTDAAPGSGRRPRIAWANRISRQKRPELLIEIARICPAYDFEVYGDIARGDYVEDDFALPNVRYRGPFGRLEDFPHGDIDVLLHTSAWDGIPTMLLAAGAWGIPIVTSAVGGIPELVTPGRGWPVDDHHDPDAYRRELEAALSDWEARLRRTRAMQDYIGRVHSREAFRAKVQALGLFDAD
jgi:glycosyltransferase involved in cell wall biosynthesis